MNRKTAIVRSLFYIITSNNRNNKENLIIPNFKGNKLMIFTMHKFVFSGHTVKELTNKKLFVAESDSTRYLQHCVSTFLYRWKFWYKIFIQWVQTVRPCWSLKVPVGWNKTLLVKNKKFTWFILLKLKKIFHRFKIFTFAFN